MKLNRDIGFLKVARSLRNEICMVVDGSSMFRCQPNEGCRSKKWDLTGCCGALAPCSSKAIASDMLDGPKPMPTTS